MPENIHFHIHVHTFRDTYNELASELLFSFSIVKYKVADERILANNIYIYDVKISQLIRNGHNE